MQINDATSAIIDEVLKFMIVGGAIASTLAIPGLIVALEKPLNFYFKGLDKRARERKFRRCMTYMKSRQLISESYKHGLTITKEGKIRLAKLQFDTLQINSLETWDGLWRIVFYDIPEQHKLARRTLKNKLNELGFVQLQRSVLIHPYPCREVIKKISEHYKVSRYISYVEALQIDNQIKLEEHFKLNS